MELFGGKGKMLWRSKRRSWETREESMAANLRDSIIKKRERESRLELEYFFFFFFG